MTRDTYEEQTWENLPSETTPVNAERLTHIEDGIKTAMDNRALKELYGDSAISIGRKSGTTVGGNSAAVGSNVEASQNFSVATGLNTRAIGYAAHAEGSQTTARAYAHAEGNSTNASATYSHAEGYYTTTTGDGSHAEGYYTTAAGFGSHAEGSRTIASGDYSHVQGKFNVEDTDKKYAHIVGGGSSNTSRKNIHTIDWTGNAYYVGDVTNGAGISLNGLKTALDNIQSSYMTYEETTAALTSQETGEINKIPNIYAIRDWCKQLTNPDSGI